MCINVQKILHPTPMKLITSSSLILLVVLFNSNLFAIDTSIVNPEPENFEISWPSTAGKTYTINRSSDLSNLNGKEGGHEATPPTNTFIINSSNNSDFFVQVKENVTNDYGSRSAAYAMNQRLGKGNNFMASKIQFGHAYLSDFILLRESGFDHVRIGSNLYKYWEDGTNNYANYKVAMKTAVDHAITAGLNVIINPIHHWANDDLTDENENYIYRFDGSTEDFIKYNEIWNDIATEFKDYPIDQVLFELMNEPHREYSIAQVISEGLTTVRSVLGNEQRIVIIAGGYGSLPNEPANAGLTTREALIDGFDSNYFPTNDPYLIGTFHYYDPRPFTKQGNPTPGLDGIAGNPGQRWGNVASDYAQVENDFDAIDTANANWANRHGTEPLPIYQGEFGVDNIVDSYGNGDRKRWLAWVRMQCENRGYSWAHWHMYNNVDSAKGLGPFDTTLSSNMVYFDFEDLNTTDAYSFSLDKIYGSSTNSTWGIPSSKGFVNFIPSNGIFQLSNDGSFPNYSGISGGNPNRGEWGLSYYGFGDSVEQALRGKVENGFATDSGKFTIETNITGWNLTSANDSTVQFQGRSSNGDIISAIRLVGKTIPIYSTTVTDLPPFVDFNFDGGSIADVVTDSDERSLFALKSPDFLPNTSGTDTYRIEKSDPLTPFYGGSHSNVNRSEWGLTYYGTETGVPTELRNKIATGFNKTSGQFIVEFEVTEWDLSNGDNPWVGLQLRDSSESVVTQMRIFSQNGHTRLKASSNNTLEHIPGGNFGRAGLKRSIELITGEVITGELSTGPEDAQTVKMNVDLDNDTITLTARGYDHVIENAGVTGRNIDTVRFATGNFGSPDFITIDRFKIHDGSSTSSEVITGYNNRTLVRAFAYDNGAATKFAEHELDSTSAFGNTAHKLAVSVDYDTGTHSLYVDDNLIAPITGVNIDSTNLNTLPLHSVRYVTSNFQNPDYINLDDVAFYEGDASPSTLAQTANGYYGASFKDMPDLRYFDADPLEGLIGVYEFEDYNATDNLTNYKGYSGNGYVDLNQLPSATLLSVYTPYQMGQNNYNLAIRYAAAQSQTVNVSVNGTTTSHEFISTGSLYDWGDVLIPISLSEGEHDITISGATSDSLNLDKAHITK